MPSGSGKAIIAHFNGHCCWNDGGMIGTLKNIYVLLKHETNTIENIILQYFLETTPSTNFNALFVHSW